MEIRGLNPSLWIKISHRLGIVAFLFILISCKENEVGTNEKVNKTNFEKLEKGMPLVKVKSIIGETFLHDPTGRTHGLSDVLPKRENRMVGIWSNNMKSDKMIICVFKDSLLFSMEYKEN